MTSPKLFFSYRKQDANLVRSLADWAKASGIAVWLDENSIPLRSSDGTPIEGEEWKSHVAAGIRESDYILLFTNSAWIQSDPCCWEFEIAQELESGGRPRIVQVCMPDDRAGFPRHQTLQQWTPTHIWSSYAAFAAFLQQHCGARLEERFSPDQLTHIPDQWTDVKGFLTTASLPSFRHARRGISTKDRAWPHRVLFAYGMHAPQDYGPTDVKISENPFQTLLINRVSEPEVLASQQPRDELIQAAYREVARAFFDSHPGFIWLGTHQFWHEGRCHCSISYLIPAGHRLGHPEEEVMERLYSLQWLDQAGKVRGEVNVTLRMLVTHPANYEIALARLGLLGDGIASRVQIPQRFAHRPLDRTIALIMTGMLILALVATLISFFFGPSFVSAAGVVSGWLFGQLLAFKSGSPLLAAYRNALRKQVFLYSAWPLAFSPVWPFCLLILAGVAFPSVFQHPLACSIVALLASFGSARARGAFEILRDPHQIRC